MKIKFVLLSIWFSLLYQMCLGQVNLITWKALDTAVFQKSYTTATNFKRIQIGDLYDDLGSLVGFTDSFNEAFSHKEMHFKNGNQEILQLQIEATTRYRKKTLQDVILIKIDQKLVKDKNYYFEMKYVWCGVNYNSNNLFVSIIDDETLSQLENADFKHLKNIICWQRSTESNFQVVSYESSSFTYNAKGLEEYIIIGSLKPKKFIAKKNKYRKAFDYWGKTINALRLCFSSIELYEINPIDKYTYSHNIGEYKTKEIFHFKEFEEFSSIDSIVIKGFADTIGLNDSLNLELAQKRADFLFSKYQKFYPQVQIIMHKSEVLAGVENRKTEVVIYRNLIKH